MIVELENTLVAGEIFSKQFTCHLDKCKGICCVEGDRGAPLENSEIETIEEALPQIKPYMTEQGVNLLQSEGFHEGLEIDDAATTCLPSGECVFVYKENGIYGCAIEKAHHAGKIDFYKPISCHLYPIRLGKVGENISVNYHQWDICSPACSLGEELNMPVFRFLKPPLIRKFGQNWYNELELVYEEFQKQFS